MTVLEELQKALDKRPRWAFNKEEWIGSDGDPVSDEVVEYWLVDFERDFDGTLADKSFVVVSRKQLEDFHSKFIKHLKEQFAEDEDDIMLLSSIEYQFERLFGEAFSQKGSEISENKVDVVAEMDKFERNESLAEGSK
jgi:GTPase SAR1 family protein